MEGAHTHLLFNHFPIIGSILSALILIAGFLLKNGTVKKTALALAVFTSLMTIPAFLSGDAAEDALKAINQAPKEVIHEHEEMGDIGIWTTMIVGLISLAAFLSSKKSFGPKLVLLALVGLMANSIFMARIGNLGGMIRHTEIRSGNAPVNVHQENESDEKN